jgi:5-formyltetrahydrofolate cyclo-ligase
MTFVGKQLPDYARRTRRLSAPTLSARAALLSGRDPSALLFAELPKAFGQEPIGTHSLPGSDAVDQYVKSMAKTIRELREAYPELLRRLTAALGAAVEGETDLAELRPPLLRRAKLLLETLVEPELRSFVLRLADDKLDDRRWLESIASFVARKPAERWVDADEEEFHQRLGFFARRFRQVEAIHFPGQGEDDNAYRIAVTCADGRQMEKIFRTNAEQEAAIRLAEVELGPLLEQAGRIGRIAAARLLLAADEDENEEAEQ